MAAQQSQQSALLFQDFSGPHSTDKTCRSRADKSGYKMGTLTFPWHAAHSLQTHSMWRVSVRLCWNHGRHNCASCPSARIIFLRTFSLWDTTEQEYSSSSMDQTPKVPCFSRKCNETLLTQFSHCYRGNEKDFVWDCRTSLAFNSLVWSLMWVNNMTLTIKMSNFLFYKCPCSMYLY